MGEVLSRAVGYNSLRMLAGALAFHFVCMFLGGFFFRKGVFKKAALETGRGTVSVSQQ
ncbi:MAG: hypothetical protein P4L50_15870 [Anaerolineaceae bacterium]|nr:hypothetical protein [Anaerolineaceae bacterium]